MKISINKGYQKRGGSSYINEVLTHKETLNYITIQENLRNYNSFAIYTGETSEPEQISLLYVMVDGKMEPRVVKPSPSGHYGSWIYDMILTDYAENIEQFFKDQNIEFISFAEIKNDEDVYQPALLN